MEEYVTNNNRQVARVLILNVLLLFFHVLVFFIIIAGAFIFKEWLDKLTKSQIFVSIGFVAVIIISGNILRYQKIAAKRVKEKEGKQ